MGLWFAGKLHPQVGNCPLNLAPLSQLVPAYCFLYVRITYFGVTKVCTLASYPYQCCFLWSPWNVQSLLMSKKHAQLQSSQWFPRAVVNGAITNSWWDIDGTISSTPGLVTIPNFCDMSLSTHHSGWPIWDHLILPVTNGQTLYDICVSHSSGCNTLNAFTSRIWS